LDERFDLALGSNSDKDTPSAVQNEIAATCAEAFTVRCPHDIAGERRLAVVTLFSLLEV
jgi:hypothetical protein